MEKCTLTVCNSTVYNSKTKQNKNTMLNDRNLGDYIVEYSNTGRNGQILRIVQFSKTEPGRNRTS